jgi:DNA-binding MarR family transcriptional regulator
MRTIYRTTDDSVLSELPLAQARILRLLYGQSRTVTMLGEELCLTPSAVTQLVNRLQDGGFVRREEDAEDRRIKHLALTPVADAMMHARRERRVARMQSILELLEPDRQQAVVDALEELVEAGGDLPKIESLSFVAEMEQAIPPAPPLRK